MEKEYLFDEQKRHSLEKKYLFGEQLYLPGKLVIVRCTHKASWKNPEKDASGRKEQIFPKIFSVAASEI